MGYCKGEDVVKLSARISGAASQNVNSKNPILKRVSNNKGGPKRGFYHPLKKRKTRTQVPKEHLFIEDVESPKTQYVGRAGEFAVMSELLFRVFNCSTMTVDDGMDMCCLKAVKRKKLAAWTQKPYPWLPMQTIRVKLLNRGMNLCGPFLMALKLQQTGERQSGH